ncbi:MAG: ribosome maturation factor RimP [Clostridiales bacterium]|nr:ribosome maturation factor RimP [Clostridiales bacterium]
MKVKPESEITSFLQDYATPLGVKIVEVDFKQGKNPSLTIFIDKDGGVDLDTCELFHNAILEPIDTLDPTFGEAYTLNVSSRGIDWAFKTDEDFLSHIGKRVEVKLAQSIRGKKFYDGELISYDKKSVTLKVDKKTTFTIELKNLVKMNEYIDFE